MKPQPITLVPLDETIREAPHREQWHSTVRHLFLFLLVGLLLAVAWGLLQAGIENHWATFITEALFAFFILLLLALGLTLISFLFAASYIAEQFEEWRRTNQAQRELAQQAMKVEMKHAALVVGNNNRVDVVDSSTTHLQTIRAMGEIKLVAGMKPELFNRMLDKLIEMNGLLARSQWVGLELGEGAQVTKQMHEQFVAFLQRNNLATRTRPRVTPELLDSPTQTVKYVKSKLV